MPTAVGSLTLASVYLQVDAYDTLLIGYQKAAVNTEVTHPPRSVLHSPSRWTCSSITTMSGSGGLAEQLPWRTQLNDHNRSLWERASA